MNAVLISADRKDRLIRERIHDPYKAKRKLHEPSVCPGCYAVFSQGRWQWANSWPRDSHQELCQACRRSRDNCPAGIVTLHGGPLLTHRNEIVNLVHNLEREENAEHPLHRIMKLEEEPFAMTIQTTDIHLPRRIGQGLRRAFKGKLTHRYEHGNCIVSVNWNRTQ